MSVLFFYYYMYRQYSSNKKLYYLTISHSNNQMGLSTDYNIILLIN